MAFTVTARHSGTNSTTESQTLVTNSQTPSANSLLLIGFGAENNANSVTQVHQTPTGGGWTYTQVGSTPAQASWDGDANYALSGSLWRATIGGSPSAHTITVDAFTSTDSAWYSAVGCDITGHDTASPVVQAAQNAATIAGASADTGVGTVTFSTAPTAGNLIVVMFVSSTDAGGAFTAPTAGSGKSMTSLFNQTQTYTHAGLWYRVADGSESATITCSDLGQAVGNYAAVAVEVKAAGGGSSSFTAAGTVAGTSSTALAVTATHTISGTVSATGASAADVTASHAVSGTVVATSAVSLTANGPGASGTVAAVSSVACTVTATHAAAGAVSATSAVAATVTATHVVAGTVVAVSAVSLSATGGENPYPATVVGRVIYTGQGEPWPMWVDSPWNILCKGGAYGEHGSTPADVFDGYAATRAAAGFNTALVLAVNSDQGGEVGPYTNGRTWDGIAPWGAGGIGDLNSAYWSRVDDLINAFGNHGITVYLQLITSYTLYTGTAFAGLNTTNGATFGTAIGNRYKNTPNIIYGFGVDYFATKETEIAAVMTAIRATGDTHLASVEYYEESGTRKDSSNATPGTVTFPDFDDVYSYAAAALEVRRSYAVTPAKPTIHVDGHYYGGSFDDKVHDDLMGWALTSGSKGMFFGSEGTWQWASGAYAALTSDSWPNNNYPATIGWFAALAKWHLLVPDTSSAFITSSRGTDASPLTPGGGGTHYSGSPQNNYLTGAVTADGTLGLIYTPTSRTITIDTSKLVAGFTAKWVDPASGTKTSTTAGSSYTHPGNNSAGHAGWYLLLEGQITSGGTVAASSSVSLAVTANLAASGSVAGTSAVSLAVTATHVVSGTVAATSGASLTIGAQQASGTVSATTTVALAVTANLNAAGAAGAVSAVSLTATVTGQLAGTVAATSTVALAVTATHTVAGQVDAATTAALAVTAAHLVAGTVAALSGVTLTLEPITARHTLTGEFGTSRLTGRFNA